VATIRGGRRATDTDSRDSRVTSRSTRTIDSINSVRNSGHMGDAAACVAEKAISGEPLLDMILAFLLSRGGSSSTQQILAKVLCNEILYAPCKHHSWFSLIFSVSWKNYFKPDIFVPGSSAGNCHLLR
jgi:hypothetical protein